jgi:hypothetical protein
MASVLLTALAASDARLEAERVRKSREQGANLASVFIDDPLMKPRLVTMLMIICGDCAGDDPLPRKTLLAADGKCSSCGGGSYILASRFFQSIKKEKAL